MTRYDGVSNTWTEMPSMKVGRCFSSASLTLDGQFVYVFGGYDGKPIDSIEK